MQREMVLALLAKKFAAPEFCFIPLASYGKRNPKAREIDAIAITLRGRRKFSVTAFEIRHSVIDFIEKDRITKEYELIGRHCSQWYLVTDDKTDSSQDTLSAFRGWIVCHDGMALIKREPYFRQPVVKPPEFFAVVMRGVNARFEEIRNNILATNRNWSK